VLLPAGDPAVVLDGLAGVLGELGAALDELYGVLAGLSGTLVVLRCSAVMDFHPGCLCLPDFLLLLHRRLTNCPGIIRCFGFLSFRG